MEFNLIDRRADFGRLQDGIEMWLEEVADPNAFRLATSHNLFHLSPFPLELGIVSFRKEWLMDEIQVDMVQSQFFQTGVNGPRDILDVGRHFGGDEEFVTRHAALLDGIAQLLFRVIYFSAIQVGITRLDGEFGSVNQLLIFGRSGIFFEPRSARTIADLSSKSVRSSIAHHRHVYGVTDKWDFIAIRECQVRDVDV